MKESVFTEKMCRELKEDGAFIIPLVASAKQQPGLPDRVVFHKKFKGPIFLEFKGEKTSLRTVQRNIICEINRRNPFTAFVVRAPNIIEYWENGEIFDDVIFKTIFEFIDYIRTRDNCS